MIIKSLDQLNSFSQKVADHLTKKDYIFLSGDIGVGKTTFTRYLINYLQKKEGSKATEVLSPTFNLLYEYDLKKCKIMHYDLYRIKNVKELNNLGIFQENENAIKIIEWPGIIKISTSDKLEIHLDYVKYDNERKLKLTGTGKWKNFNGL
jgi:tRNA threonylcarbamoyladenosine biosynthesis protein TsaE